MLIGNHRDAWTFGGADPSSGTATMLEVAKALGWLKTKGSKQHLFSLTNELSMAYVPGHFKEILYFKQLCHIPAAKKFQNMKSSSVLQTTCALEWSS